MLNTNHRLRHAAHHVLVLQHTALRRSSRKRGSGSDVFAGIGGFLCKKQHHNAPFCNSVGGQQHQDPALQSTRADDPVPDGTGEKRPVNSEEKRG